jgi:DNA adenine methylase
MQNFSSPLRYPGGKTKIYNFVSSLILENNLVGINYAEPYAGGAGLALSLLYDEFVNKIHINDFDYSIFTLWKTLLERNDDFCHWVKGVEINVENWLYYKNVQANQQDFDDFELAKSTFFLNRTNVSGVIKGGIIGGLNQNGKYKIDARFNKNTLIARIKKIYDYRDRIIVSNLDGIKFIKNLEGRRKDFFVYIDPPYYEKASNLYMNYYVAEDHEKLSKHIKKMNNIWLTSYDSHDFILQLYHEESKVNYKLSQSASNRVGDEVLIFSERLNFEQSITKLQNPCLLA